jgi:hypothetical protein
VSASPELPRGGWIHRRLLEPVRGEALGQQEDVGGLLESSRIGEALGQQEGAAEHAAPPGTSTDVGSLTRPGRLGGLGGGGGIAAPVTPQIQAAPAPAPAPSEDGIGVMPGTGLAQFLGRLMDGPPQMDGPRQSGTGVLMRVTKNANVRAAPNGAKIGSLAAGTVVPIGSCQGSWCPVSASPELPRGGWVHRRLLEPAR